jgi:Calcium/calmodulin dependent protein kinase II association domain
MAETAAVLRANEELLAAIGDGDWAAYERLCAPDLTAFEPEAGKVRYLAAISRHAALRTAPIPTQ